MHNDISQLVRSRNVQLISVIVPVFNEAESLEQLHQEISQAMRAWGRSFEIVYVNDGSRDGSELLLDDLAEMDDCVRVVHFRRNFGQTAALSAGIEFADGDVLVPMDADLQNDPADIPALVEKLEEGYDVVSGWRKDRHDKFLTRKLPSQMANWLIGRVTNVSLHDYGCTLKAYRRDVMDGVRLYGEMHRFLPLYAYLQGGQITELAVNHRARTFGQSKYGLGRIYKVILDLLLVKFLASYANRPIHVFGGVGLGCVILSFLMIFLSAAFKFSPVAAWQKDFVETPLPFASGVLFLVGVLAILQGLISEMLMRTYFEAQDKRPYLVRRFAGGARSAEASVPVNAHSTQVRS